MMNEGGLCCGKKENLLMALNNVEKPISSRILRVTFSNISFVIKNNRIPHFDHYFSFL